jgi:H+/Cl- antiporter ClcA
VNFRKSCSITPRSKWRFVVAMLVSLLLIAGWVWLFTYFATQARGRPS